MADQEAIQPYTANNTQSQPPMMIMDAVGGTYQDSDNDAENQNLVDQQNQAAQLQAHMMVTPAEVAELRRQVALENIQNQRMDKLDQDIPTEFECCFCTTKGHERCQGECIPLRENSV